MICVTDEVTEVKEYFLIVLECLDEAEVVLKIEIFSDPVKNNIKQKSYLQNGDKSLVHLKLLSLKLLIGSVYDCPIQICHVNVRVGNQSCASVQQRICYCTICYWHFDRLLLLLLW